MQPFPPIAELAARLRDGRSTSEALVEHCLRTIERHDGELNAFIAVLADEARTRARRADRELGTGQDLGPLHGIPVSVKDLIDLEGTATTAASASRAGHRADRDAPILARLRAAGAVFIGKCNLHELALGTTGEDSAYGPTRNPHTRSHIPGGSSSGSAVSVASGMAVASVGSDTGGSIRIPAAACGVVGLKPTFDELSCEGVVPLAATLDHVGPIGATVDDVARLYQVMAGRPPVGVRKDNETSAVALGLPVPYFLDLLDTAVRHDFETELARLRRDGDLIEEVTLRHADEIADVYRHTVLYEAFRAHKSTLQARPDAFSPAVRSRLEVGATVSDEQYRSAQSARATLRAEVDTALTGRDGLVLPTLPVVPPPLGTETLVVDGHEADIRALTLRLTQLFDLTGHPAISVPMGQATGGLPTGLQLVGHRGGTDALLALAAARFGN